jgi:RNA polymerase sigma factor (sigma-70 family)
MSVPNDQSGDTIFRVIGRLRADGPPDEVAAAEADRVLRRLEPVARRTCQACGAGLTPDRIEELVQDTLLVAWRRLPDFEPALGGEGNAPALERWVKQIARFTHKNAVRTKRETLSEDGILDVADPAVGALAWLAQAERDELVWRAIDTTLTTQEQDVLYERHVHGLERAEIARMFGLADADAVRVILQRTQRRLQVALTARLRELQVGMSIWHEDFRG